MARRTTLERLGAAVKKLRKAAGLTQQQLAEQASLAVESVSRLEGGKLNVSVIVADRGSCRPWGAHVGPVRGDSGSRAESAASG
jgi:DNA-binding XRE family transcriptional regulator